MLMLLALALNPSVVSAERVQASIMTVDGKPIADVVSWARLAMDGEIKPLLPKGKIGLGYAHILCTSIRANGQPFNCQTSRDGLGQNASLDADFERIGLKAVQLMRVDPSVTKRAVGKKLSFHISIAFKNGDGVRRWGDCYPFCQAGLPQAPVVPSR